MWTETNKNKFLVCSNDPCSCFYVCGIYIYTYTNIFGSSYKETNRKSKSIGNWQVENCRKVPNENNINTNVVGWQSIVFLFYVRVHVLYIYITYFLIVLLILVDFEIDWFFYYYFFLVIRDSNKTLNNHHKYVFTTIQNTQLILMVDVWPCLKTWLVTVMLKVAAVISA